MPFQYLLTNLLVDVPGAEGAIFLDGEGEAIEFVTKRSTPYELKLEGAYHGIFLRRAAQLAQLVGAGSLDGLSISGGRAKVMSHSLRDGYYLVLVMEAGSPVSIARTALKRVGDALNREIP